MANITYDSPSALAPKIDFAPDGFLGGMWARQRQNDYRQAVEQSNLMKALAAKEEMNKLQEYGQNAPVRDAERLSKIAGFNSNAATIGDIQGGQAAQGRMTAQTAPQKMEYELAQWKASQSKWKQEDIDRHANSMEAVGETLFNSPGHDTLEGQAERDSLLKKFKSQYPDLGLPDTWSPEAEKQVFQRYQIAKTLKSIKMKEELAKTEASKSADLEGRRITAASNEKIQAAHDATKLEAARTASQRAQTLEKRLDALLEEKFIKPNTWNAQKEAFLLAITKERDLALAAKAAALGITTGMMAGGTINPTQMGTDASKMIQTMRGTPANSAINAPKPGEVQDGYMFNGGNPADPNNWTKQ